MESNSKTKNVVIFLVLLSIILILVIVISFSSFFKKQEKNVREIVKTGTVSMNYKSEVNGLQLVDLTPVSDSVAKENRVDGSYFDFSVSSEFDNDSIVDYEITLIKDQSSTIPDEDVMVYLEKQSSGTYAKVKDPQPFTAIKKKTKLGSPAKSMVLDKVSLSSDQLEDIRMGRKTPDTLLSNTDKRFFKLVQDHLKDVDNNVDYTKKVTKTTIKTDDKGKSFSMSTYSKDRNFLGRAVASLRSIYRNWLQKYNMEQDPKKKTMIKSLLAKIMNFIDRIMVKLQNKLS